MPRPVRLARNLRFVVVFALVVVVQALLAHRFRVFSFFDLPLITSIYCGFSLGNPVASVFIGSALGLMQDSLSGAYLGVNGFSKALIAFLSASAGSKFDVDQIVTRVFALLLFTVLDALVVAGLGLVLYPDPSQIRQIPMGALALSVVFNTLSGMIVFGYMERRRSAVV